MPTFKTNIMIINMALADLIAILLRIAQIDYEVNDKSWRFGNAGEELIKANLVDLYLLKLNP